MHLNGICNQKEEMNTEENTGSIESCVLVGKTFARSAGPPARFRLLSAAPLLLHCLQSETCNPLPGNLFHYLNGGWDFSNSHTVAFVFSSIQYTEGKGKCPARDVKKNVFEIVILLRNSLS